MKTGQAAKFYFKVISCGVNCGLFLDHRESRTWDSHHEIVVLKSFELQQPAFTLQSPGIATQTGVGRDHAMTGNDKAQGIPAVGRSYSATGLGSSNPVGEFTIGDGLSIRNA